VSLMDPEKTRTLSIICKKKSFPKKVEFHSNVMSNYGMRTGLQTSILVFVFLTKDSIGNVYRVETAHVSVKTLHYPVR